MNGAGLFFLLLFLLVIIPAACFVIWTRWSAHRRGLPAPPLSAYNPIKAFKNRSSSSGGRGGGGGGGGGPVNWVKDKFASLRDHRAGQGYAGQTRGARGFGPLDPDAAWDDRVGFEADGIYDYGGGNGRHTARNHGYEEQELGMHAPASTRSGAGAGAGAGSPPIDQGPYGMHATGGSAMPAYDEERGRARSREDLSYHGHSTIGPQELDARFEAAQHGGYHGGSHTSAAGHSTSPPLRGLSPRPAGESPSPKYERRSIFRENV